MRLPLLMPKLGLTMEEGALTEWMLRPGAKFKAGDGLFIIETDKVATEIAADGDGVLEEIVVDNGESVPVGTVIGYWDDGAAERLSTVAPGDASEPVMSVPVAEAIAMEPVAIDAVMPAGTEGRRIVATPLARRLASEAKIDLATLQGIKPGRIRAADVQAAIDTNRTQRASSVLPASVATSDSMAAAGQHIVKPSATQATIARRLTAAKRDTPHFYLAAEAEVSRLLALRATLNANKAEPRLTLNHFILAAVGRALREVPEANRVWSDEGIVHLQALDVGMAINTGRGLLAPVLRDAGALRFAELVREARALVERARGATLAASELSGAAVTVSNAGMFNVTYMTPIINPGQSLILGVGAVRELFRPDAAGQPALRRELGLVLAADHRLHDGVSGMRFLNAVMNSLEQPLPLLLEL